MNKLIVKLLLLAIVAAVSLNALSITGQNGDKTKTKTSAQRKSGRAVVSLDETDDDDNEESLFYQNDDLTTAASSLDSETSTSVAQDEPELSYDEKLQKILQEIYEIKQTDGNSLQKFDHCDKYKPKLFDACSGKFRESVQSYQYTSDEWDDKKDSDLDWLPDQPVGGAWYVPNTQQICCEYRLTYLSCALPNVNLVCGPTELNSLLQPYKALTRICSEYYSKSLKKCKRHYRAFRKQQTQQKQQKPLLNDQETLNSTSVRYV